MNIKKAVYFFCNDLSIDPVASNVIKYCEEMMDLKYTDIMVDDNLVLEFKDINNNVFQFVKTKNVISHDYKYYLPILNKYYLPILNKYYLPILNKYFKDFDFAGVVNCLN